MKRRTVLSMEQALSLSHATLRFAHLGWRVIRLEAAPSGKGLPGDPNRYIGTKVVDDDRRSYFIAPNVGKETIALNLKEASGRELLHRIIKELDVDIFCCNTLPSRYEALGIDYPTLSQINPQLIWAGISAMGPDYPNRPGYDPAIQAMVGFMEVTGDPNGPPMLAGVPVIDFKAGDEVFANVCLALAELSETGKGSEIHVSMLQAASSWLTTTLPLLDFDCHPSEVSRCGNEHRKFIPVNAYPTADGFVFVAIGNDVQWERLTDVKEFASLRNEGRKTNAGRIKDQRSIHEEMAVATSRFRTLDLMNILESKKIPHAPINTIRQVRDMDAIAPKLTTTKTPSGQTIHLPPMAVDLEVGVVDLEFAPSYSQNTVAVLAEAGLSDGEIERLAKEGIIPG